MSQSPSTPPGCEDLHGVRYMRMADGGLRPLSAIKPKDLLRDQLVRNLINLMQEESARLAGTVETVFREIDAFREMSAREYGAKLGGAGGNISLETLDGTLRIEVQVSEIKTVSSDIESAKSLIDEFLALRLKDVDADISALVLHAFKLRKGQYDLNKLLALKQLNITHELWLRAMAVIADCIEVKGSKRYTRGHYRAKATDAWRNISLDAATATDTTVLAADAG